jgi:DNA-binding transcriptional ArsR family regulator
VTIEELPLLVGSCWRRLEPELEFRWQAHGVGLVALGLPGRFSRFAPPGGTARAAECTGYTLRAARTRGSASGLHCGRATYILNLMVQHSRPHFNASFAALSDATRRGVLEQLARADASITELADKFGMTLTGMKKHVGVLEQAGLVTSAKVGRVRTCTLGPCRLEDEMEWITNYRQVWEARFQALDRVIEKLKQEKFDGRRKAK